MSLMSWCIASAAKWIKTRRCSTPSEESAMSSGRLDFLRRNIGVRLGLWYALIFAVSNALLFTLVYYLLATAIGSKDREVLASQVKQAADAYQNGGMTDLRGWVSEQPESVRNTLLVRLVNAYTHLQVVVAAPPGWVTSRDVPGFEGFLTQQFMR